MSIFGYPADIIHMIAVLDSWNRVIEYEPVSKKAKVVEEQKLIKNDKGEDVLSIAEIHIEGAQHVKTQDHFIYTNALGMEIRYEVKHIEIKKNLGTDEVKKVVIYG
ncbi:hypothetical protein PZE06_20895 [Robertmurraya sp. DFI.2.37]|uniref:hypothetical protein n=1 Tax=Robertmurraya sp. DFI.2.37 TaxID=3031819 RepID=UPI001248DF89|nr:hypothetical protein [Robertmurraya sp. DFI.2.37]MDF1510595.1 hypothetical protein [Robertmurraya sp. DFI.2.37]